MSDNWYKTGRRAVTDAEKDEIIDRLREIWKANPSLRFMQLLGNTYRGDTYYSEDYDMLARIEEYYSESRIFASFEPPPGDTPDKGA